MSENSLTWVENYFREAFQGPVLENFLDIKIEELSEGKTVYKTKIIDKHCNMYGYVHGGTLASISDAVMGSSCITLGRRVVTIDMNISYIKNVTMGSTLTAVGEVIANGKNIMRALGKIFDENHQLLVRSEASYFVTGDFSKEDHPKISIKQ